MDASIPTADDGAIPIGACGDGRLDPMESCDDGNTLAGDGCDGSCRREAHCGDGAVDPAEVCDDGNNASGDGCRSDCQSDESCGNGIRDVVVGELCDDGNRIDGDGCSADCRLLEMCGDGVLQADTAGEQCDDANPARWDGCGPDCLLEQSQVIRTLEIGGPAVGCDFSGDGVPDNSFGRALRSVLPLVNDMFLRRSIEDGDVILLLSMMGLDDPSGRDDSSFTIAWMQGDDADADPANNLGGAGLFHPGMGALDPAGNPVASFESDVRGASLMGGPEDISIPLGFLPLDIRDARLHGTTTSSGADGQLWSIEEGLLCGAMPLSGFAFLPNLTDLFGGTTTPPCDETMEPSTMADLLVGGAPTGFLLPLRGADPDVDLDGDGLESFIVDSSGPAGCQPVIIACIDGDGTRLEGRDCPLDPRFADGFSTGLPFTSIRAQIVAPPVP